MVVHCSVVGSALVELPHIFSMIWCPSGPTASVVSQSIIHLVDQTNTLAAPLTDTVDLIARGNSGKSSPGTCSPSAP